MPFTASLCWLGTNDKPALPLKVLLTNAYMDVYAGTQVVVKDLALELRRQGHQPMVYSPRLGAVGESLTRSGIQVTDQLSNLAAVPDIIHGQHYPAVEALLHFPSTPAVYVCHSAMPGYTEALSYFPSILRYVAVDEVCKKRIAGVPGIPPERIQVFFNAVDLERFQPRAPLPSRPKRALVFSNNAATSTYLPAVRRACRRAGLEVHVAGLLSGSAVPNPENLLPRYDIVFAKARCALEAMAVGNAVVLCDFKGLGPMVSTKNFDTLRPINFGSSATVNPLRADLIQKQLELYDPYDAAAVSQRVRQEVGLQAATQRWIQLYSDVIDEFRQTERNPAEELRALALYLNQWNYARRVEWELEQLKKLHSVPLVGRPLTYFARRFLRKRLGVYHIP